MRKNSNMDAKIRFLATLGRPKTFDDDHVDDRTQELQRIR